MSDSFDVLRKLESKCAVPGLGDILPRLHSALVAAITRRDCADANAWEANKEERAGLHPHGCERITRPTPSQRRTIKVNAELEYAAACEEVERINAAIGVLFPGSDYVSTVDPRPVLPARVWGDIKDATREARLEKTRRLMGKASESDAAE